MTGRRRPRSVRKARAFAISHEERAHAKDPHSFVFTRPGVGRFVKQLSLDLRSVFEPYTASKLKVTRRNVLKDFITIAGPLHVTHLCYLTHPRSDKLKEKRLRQYSKRTKQSDVDSLTETVDPEPNSDSSVPSGPGGVYLHLVRIPHGPSLTFSVCEYSLQRDVLSLVRRMFDSHQFSSPPLLAMTGFGSLIPGAPNSTSQPPPPHLRLVVDMFQNMLPALNVQKVKLSTVRRVLLISREVDLSTTNPGTSDDEQQTPDDIIYIRHYHIRTENREISRALRRLQVGGARSKRRRANTATPGLGPGGSGKPSGVPNLSKYTSMEDFLTQTGMLSDSCVSDALSDMEECELPTNASLPLTEQSRALKRKTPSHGLKHLSTAKRATIRLTEIGPRLTLKLIKIEEGINTGTVLYHRWQSRTMLEVSDQAERLRRRESERAARRAVHEAGRAANEAAREAHRAACLEGMRKAGQLPAQEDESVAQQQQDDSGSETSESEESVPLKRKKTLTGKPKLVTRKVSKIVGKTKSNQLKSKMGQR